MRDGLRNSALLLIFACAALAGVARAEDASGWEILFRERGIEVSRRDQPGRSLPDFRGVATLRGSLLHVLSVVLDDVRSKEWAASVQEASVLRTIDDRTHVVYSRSDLPWPVRDRDLVMRRTVEIVNPGSDYFVNLTCIAGEKPPRDDTIRIARCSTSFRLRKIDADRTLVDYRVHAEPGGNNPDWIVRMMSRDIPLDTLLGLQRQIDATRGAYAKAMKQWANAR